MKTLAALLLTLAIARLFVTALHDPVIGYGNNWDFIRLQSCVGLWPAYGDKPKESNNPQAPIQTYTYDGDRRTNLCMPSTDLLFLKLALIGAKPGSKIDIRVVGAMRATLLSVLLILLFAAVGCATYRLFVALAALLIFGDIAFASYFNTLYTEFSVVSGVFLITTAICGLVYASRRSSLYVVLAVGFMLLVLSKEQYTFLAAGLMLVAAAIIARVYRAVPVAVGCIIVAIAGPVLQQSLGRSAALAPAINLANKTNTVLWAVLPNAHHLPSALSILGLPESCAGGVGRSWYSPGVQENHPCPAVSKVSRLRLLPLFATQPRTLLVPIAEAAARSRPWAPDHLSNVERRRGPASWVYRWIAASSPSTWVGGLPSAVYSAGLLLSVLLSGIGAVSLAAWLRRGASTGGAVKMGDSRTLVAGMVLGGAVAAYSLGSSVFGDGYHEIAKHAVGLGVGLMIQAAALTVLGLRVLASWLRLRQPPQHED